MTDRELLELAAKAIGEKCEQMGSGKFGLYKPRQGYMQAYINWDPLEDDGDALRLAVKLHMCVTSFTDEQMVGFVVGKDGRNVHEAPGIDPYAATRRAIVRAAAEIGRSMK